MVYVRAACLVASFALVACSKDASPADPNGGVARLEVAPSALLLVQPGDLQTLTVIAYDDAGQPVDPELPITWTSTHPEVVSVSDTGEVVASELVGSTQIIAHLGSIEAAPVTVLVVRAVAEAVMVTDAQIDGPIRPTGGRDFEVTLRDVPALSVGAVVLSREAIPLAGRVTAIADAGGGLSRVSMVAVDLNEAFTTLRIGESYTVPSAPFAAVANARAHDGGPLHQALETEFRYGLFECEASATPQIELSLPLTLKLEPTVDIDWALDIEGGELTHHRMVAKGGFVLSPSGVFETTAAFSAEMTCELELFKFVIPIGGAVSFFIAPAVPLGVGFTIEGSFELAQARFGLEGKLGATVSAGYDYTPEAGLTMVDTFTPISEFSPIVEWPGSLTEDLRIKFGAQLFGFAKLAVQVFPTLPGDRSFEVLEITAGPELGFDYGTESAQATDTAYASAYNAKLKATAGLGSGITDVLEVLGGAVAVTPPEVSYELDLAASPTGELSASAQTVETNETVTFTVNISGGATFLGIPNVSSVSVHELFPNGSLAQISEIPGAFGQTSFQMQWIPDTTETGNHKFVAFVRPEVLGLEDLPRFEVAPTSQVSVNVHNPGEQPAEFINGVYTFSYAPSGVDCYQGYDQPMTFFPNGAVTGSVSNFGQCTNAADQLFRHPIGSWIVDDGPSTVFIDFCAWTSNAAPAHSVQLTYNGAKSRWEGDYSEYQPGWVACLTPVFPGYNPGCVAGSTCVTVSDATCQGEPVPPFILQCINSDCCTQECPSGGPPPWHEVPLTCY